MCKACGCAGSGGGQSYNPYLNQGLNQGQNSQTQNSQAQNPQQIAFPGWSS